MADKDQQSIELARWFVGQLRGKTRSQQQIMLGEEADQVRRVYGANTDKLLEARQEYFRLRGEGVEFPIPEGRLDETSGIENTPTPRADNLASGAAGAAAIGVSKLLGKNYYEMVEEAERKAQKALSEWEKEEAALSTNPRKQTAPGRPQSAEEAYRKALAQEYDSFVASGGRNNKKAYKWTKEHPDDNILAQSLIRYEVLKGKLTPERARELKKRYVELEEKTLNDLPLAERAAKLWKFKNIAAGEFDNLLAKSSPEIAASLKTTFPEKPDLSTKRPAPTETTPQSTQPTEVSAATAQAQPSNEATDSSSADTARKAAQKARNREIIESLRSEGVNSPYSQRGGSIDNAWPEYQPRALARPNPTPVSPSEQAIPRPSLPRIPASRWGGDESPAPLTRRAGKGGKTGRMVARGAARIAGMALSNPVVAGTIIGVGAALVLLLIILANICSLPFREIWAPVINPICGVVNLPSPPALPEGTSITIDWPKKIPNGQPITYKIVVTYDSSLAKAPLEDMTLVVAPNFDHEFVSSAPTPELTRGEAPRNNYTWELSKLPGELSGTTTTFKIDVTVKPSPDTTDIKVENWVYIEGVGGLDASEGENSPSTSNTCNGKYTDNMTAIHKDFPLAENTNFGDPSCSYSKSKLKSALQSLDPSNADFWMDIIRCESSYNPNSYDRQDPEGNDDTIQHDIDQGERMPDTKLYKGTWGLFQMRRSFKQPFNQRGIEDKNDRGDVPWQIQIQNAISYNRDRAREGNNFVYWEAAQCLCATARHSGKSYCKDVKAKNCSSCN